MSQDKMREEFERELIRQGVSCTRRVHGEEAELYGLEDGDYFGLEARSGWRFWQASRESLVIDLPTQSEGNRPYNQGIYDTKVAIEVAGVKVKP